MRTRLCRACGWLIVRDGDVNLFVGTQLVHNAATCSAKHRAVPSITILGRTVRV